MKSIKSLPWMLIAIAFLAVGAFQNSTLAKGKTTGKTEHVNLLVSGMSCQYCSKGLESSLCKLKGAENVKADYKTGIASLDVPLSTLITKDQLKQAVSDAGFTLKEVKFTEETQKPSDSKQQSQ